MSPSRTDAPAAATPTDFRLTFELALQRSEGRRALVLLGTLAVFVSIGFVRRLVAVDPMTATGFSISMALVVLAAAYIVGLWLFVRGSTNRLRVLPLWFWAATTLVESAFPAAMLFDYMVFSNLDPANAVTSPIMVSFAVFAVISVLRLRPGLCLLGGSVSFLLHMALTLYALGHTSEDERPGFRVYYTVYPVVMLIAWVAAAVVARELRRHLLASVRNSEARRELGAVREELRVASAIQTSLLPVDGLLLNNFELVGLSRPAAAANGDLYDWTLLESGRVGFSIADVTGHGLGAALISAAARAYARASSLISRGEREALIALNRLIAADMTDGRFVTMALGVIDGDARRVRLISAGHGPIVFLRVSDQTVAIKGGDGPPLGVIPDATFDDATVYDMQPGDILLIVTDGIVEAKSAGREEYGIDRLTTFLKEHAARPGREILDLLEADVRAHAAGPEQEDDMTAILVRCTS